MRWQNLKSLLMTLNSFLGIIDDLFNIFNINSIYLYNFSTDIVENHFSKQRYLMRKETFQVLL